LEELAEADEVAAFDVDEERTALEVLAWQPPKWKLPKFRQSNSHVII